MRVLWEAGVDPRHHQDCVRLFTMASVEFAHLNGELGVFDRDRIQNIANLYDVPLQAVTEAWWAASHAMTQGFESRKRAALPHFEAGKLTVIAHKRLFEMIEASRAFEKTPERDKALFGKRPGRPRINTGMTTLPPVYEYTLVPAVPDGPGASRFTTAQRKVLAAELGVKIETLRGKERDLTEAAFDAWADRRRRTTATRLKNEAERKARAGRRRRKPEKTAAIRAFAARSGWSERKSWEICRGLSAEEIIARTPFTVMHELPRQSSCNDRVTKIPDDCDEELSRNSSRCSAKCSDKKGGYPAFLCNSSPPSTASDNTSVTTKAKRRASISVIERWLLTEWFKATQGRAPSEGLFRQWRSRRVLKARIREASEWHHDNHADDEFDADDSASRPCQRIAAHNRPLVPMTEDELPF